MLPETIPFGQYTHILFSYVTVNPETYEIWPGNDEDILKRIRSISLIQPDIKIWVAVGGWSSDNPKPTQTMFSEIPASAENSEAFLDSLVRFMNSYKLHGIDIDWQYPIAEDHHGRTEDRKNLVTFMSRLRQRLNMVGKGLSMTIPADYEYLQQLDIAALEPTVDWFNIMSYDLHGAWDFMVADNMMPQANSHTNLTEIRMALDVLWQNDISPQKITMGMTFYGRSFTLTDPSCNILGCRMSSVGNPGRCSNAPGVLLNTEIKQIIDEKSLIPILDPEAAVNTVSWDNQWVSFDDANTWRLKGDFFRSQCIEGVSVHAITQDDRDGTHIKALNEALDRLPMKPPNFKTAPKSKSEFKPIRPSKLCRWTSCFEGCPLGFKEVQNEGHKQTLRDSTPCQSSKWGHGFTRFCCPSDNPQPTCTWRGYRSSGKCKPGCADGEIEVGMTSTGCHQNHQTACCKESAVVQAYGKCTWTDCRDNSKSACSDPYPPYFVTDVGGGSGGLQSCRKGQKRAYCCTDPPPPEFSGKCKWVRKAGHLRGDEYKNVCEGACPPDYIRLALESGFVASIEHGDSCLGDKAFCCEAPAVIPPWNEDKTQKGSSKLSGGDGSQVVLSKRIGHE
jgi:chitinase